MIAVSDFGCCAGGFSSLVAWHRVAQLEVGIRAAQARDSADSVGIRAAFAGMADCEVCGSLVVDGVRVWAGTCFRVMCAVCAAAGCVAR